jgi:hypothetical protein
VSPARLREIADTLPGYVCGQIKFHADAWERDLADVEHFRTLARGYMDERDEARAELAAALEATREEGRRAGIKEVVAWLRAGRKRHPQPMVLDDLADLIDSNLNAPAEPGKNTP